MDVGSLHHNGACLRLPSHDVATIGKPVDLALLAFAVPKNPVFRRISGTIFFKSKESGGANVEMKDPYQKPPPQNACNISRCLANKESLDEKRLLAAKKGREPAEIVFNQNVETSGTPEAVSHPKQASWKRVYPEDITLNFEQRMQKFLSHLQYAMGRS